jgi:hypothetical protein
VQLTYHREDFRQALPVLLVRRPNLLGGEFRVPLDPCIHPVRLLPVTMRMASKMEFALEFGWQTKQVRMRAPDANTYRQWSSLVRAALESGRRPLASCDSTAAAERPRHDFECSSLASTLNSSQATFNATIRQRVPEEEAREEEEEEDTVDYLDRGLQRHNPSEFFVLYHADYHPEPQTRPGVQDDVVHYNWHLSLSSSEANGSSSCYDPHPSIDPVQADAPFWSSHGDILVDYAAMIHELVWRTRFLFFL